ncbi:type III-B CRISPR-associated protein Cas10/Cmr2 [Aliterella atlantica]|uniref:CRISPR-associated protein Crm2 n=1 Tax=Aliterella atlantica CENA595 TaxID=1618023 RepID=A0A0D8ZPW2_9CYAN|nr:type III-B CRISPR-associated protein Cas10/Cmr2 [Aliterella atlantica]KJH70760.1 CRISPR-associated protein Crm2 [Aliterella atlantica CENA595]
MSDIYWQAKIWGLLHDPALKALHNNSGRGENSCWQELAVMKNWQENNWNPEDSQGIALKHILLADYITSASDRSAIGSLSASINYAPKKAPNKGLEIAHLLSGAKHQFKLNNAKHQELISQPHRGKYLSKLEQDLFSLQITDPSDRTNPQQLKTIREVEDKRKLFWWLWRCLPIATCNAFGDEQSLLLMPAETRIPDSSIWSHTSLTAALSGALAGYDLTAEELQRWTNNKTPSHPYLAIFSFSPVQELIKASRKMRDFWAGSWLLHYLCAKVSWALAWKYGPDCLVYPSLFAQPLIDNWLLEKWADFQPWVKQPTNRQLLTAGFPNVLVLILPKDKVASAMQLAEQTLRTEWLKIGSIVLTELQSRHWMPGLEKDSKNWNGWLDSQWQTYWTASPIGKEGEQLKNSAIPKTEAEKLKSWLDTQNIAYNLQNNHKEQLFQAAELDFLRAAYDLRLKQQRKFSVNVGSWWCHVFDQTRLSLAAVKNARNWQLPTAFSVRSTVSGIGAAVHPGDDWLPEGEVKKLWKRHAGLFDGKEQLNATETLKRGLHKVLPQLIGDLNANAIDASYPDLTAGVAGYLKVSDFSHLEYFHKVCRFLKRELSQEVPQKWGIPWIDEHQNADLQKFPSRYLNAGWLAEEIKTSETQQIEQKINREQDPSIVDSLNQELIDIKNQYRATIQTILDKSYPANNPSDWYVLAAGDGDGMSEWLKGKKLKNYRDYIPTELSSLEEDPDNNSSEESPEKRQVRETFPKFLNEQKRMGPSTHSALSRALLDFSNQLVPYLTEQRYAGRLIYSGGDDVLAYTNLWEWDNWVWDIRQCFRGAKEDSEFENKGDYWCWKNPQQPPQNLSARPLFTMGSTATISFGIVIAHHSVPLAIALESLWEAEAQAKEHIYVKNNQKQVKDAIQARVIYGNGNTLKVTSKFDVFDNWRSLVELTKPIPNLDSAIFEQAAQVWQQHPAPIKDAIASWTQAFCNRRDLFAGKDEDREKFSYYLTNFIATLWETTTALKRDEEIQNWLKLAAFVLRNRHIAIGNI